MDNIIIFSYWKGLLRVTDSHVCTRSDNRPISKNDSILRYSHNGQLIVNDVYCRTVPPPGTLCKLISDITTLSDF